MITQEDVIGIQRAAQMLQDELNNMPADDAREYATQLWIDAGILNADGTEKEQIVEGDFFGW